MLRKSFGLLALTLSVVLAPSLRAGTFEVADRNELNRLMVELRAQQFLSHATFGPTDAEVQALSDRMMQVGIRRAASEWIDNQFATAPTLHQPLAEAMVAADGFDQTQSGINVTRYRYHAWWHNAITAEDQLRQRTAWALMQICVVGETGSNFNNRAAGKTGKGRWLGLSNYYDMLLHNSFGNYRDVVGGVTFHPIMGVWLSHLRNEKANPSQNIFPDENYAREILQLFTIGLYLMNPDGTFQRDSEGELIPTYGNPEIETFARLFTGLTYNQSRALRNGTVNFQEPMMMFDSSHDQDPKQVFGGVTLPGGVSGVADINAGLDNILDHPNIGPFIARRLIQRLVRSNPSRGYLYRVVRKWNDNGSGVRGDMKAVLKAILLDQEAWDGIRMVRRSDPWRLEVSGAGTEKSRLQEPVAQYVSFVRRYGSTDNPNGYFNMNRLNYNWAQYPYGSPSVFNFYSPDFQPAGDIKSYTASRRIPERTLYAPEFQILDGVFANRTPNRYRADVINRELVHTNLNNDNGVIRTTISYDFSEEIALASDPEALVEHLDAKLCCGTMSNSMRQKLVETLGLTTNETNRYRIALMGVLNSPAFAIAE
ncbi:MAG: DUF1800 family protein [Planctomycetota bacterium]|nr:DUF1800 family protein [Planctomycetota bacterium]